LRYEVQPDLNDYDFTEGGPKAWFMVARTWPVIASGRSVGGRSEKNVAGRCNNGKTMNWRWRFVSAWLTLPPSLIGILSVALFRNLAWRWQNGRPIPSLLLWIATGSGIAAVVGCVPASIRLSQIDRWRREGKCVRCGYDMRATPTRCPECGMDLPDFDG
jgi:hypothetical protein